jgi:protein-S-isoprenylcysteine O-methyltransferase Ste14
MSAQSKSSVDGSKKKKKGSEQEDASPSSKKDDTAYRGPRPLPRTSKPLSIWQRATYRWTAITSVMAALLVMYTQHPYYHNVQFVPFKTIYPPAFVLWLIFGLFYVKATLQKFDGQRFMMRDGGLHLVMLAKAWQQKRFWRIAKNRRVKTTLLAIIVKAFFTPLMTGFVVGHLGNISKALLVHKHLPTMEYKVPNGANIFTAARLWWENAGHRLTDLVPSLHDLAGLVQPWAWSRSDLSWGLGLAYDIVFAVDCGWALLGYAGESRWLGNKTRSVEPTAFGWTVCLACYPPFNNVLGTYLPLENGVQQITSEAWLLALRGGVVILFAIYASATVSFGLKFSNLTNRGIVSRGPYRFVRHPAYLCKCAAWWLEHIPTITIAKAFFLTLLCGVYALRAWTEERHLGMDPEYRAYKKKTPWILFPGIY